MVAVVDKVKKLNRLAKGSSPLVSGGVTDDEYSKNTLTQRRKTGTCICLAFACIKE